MQLPSIVFITSLLSVAVIVAHAHEAPLIQHPSSLRIMGDLNVEGEYIVVLREDASLISHMSSSLMGAVSRYASSHSSPEANQVLHIYETLNGYGARLTPDVLAAVREDEQVAYVEENQIISVNMPNEPYTSSGEATQWRPVSWGLERVSHRDLPLTGRYDYHARAGDGVTVYVVDTGVNIHHAEFEGRAVWGITTPSNDRDEDGNGHGTHVAGTIAGSVHGIAKKAKIVAVKVLKSNGSGSMADVVKGIDWVAQQHSQGKSKKSVANMSLGGKKSPALNQAVETAIKRGVHFAVAAGNENSDACNTSPASAQGVYSVGASTVDDKRATFSNWGNCVTLFAPGFEITSAWIGSTVATKKISGTSMASPHVAGVAALLLSERDYSDAELRGQIKNLATSGRLSDVRGSPNLLLHNGIDSRKVGPRLVQDEQAAFTVEKVYF